ncbi:MAG: hypothetical protein R3B13_20605 [Polyangiaceae bacterium]
MSDERLPRDGDALLGRLLRAGDAEEPSSRTLHKVLLATTAAASATGAAGAATATGATGAATAAGAGSLLSGSIVKWLGIGALFGVGASVAVQTAIDAGAPSSAATGSVVVAAPASAGTVAAPASAGTVAAPTQQKTAAHAKPVTPTSGTPVSNPSPPTATSTKAPTSANVAASAADLSGRDSTTLKDELLVLERARTAVNRGDGSGASAAIAEYRSRFPNGRLYPELTLVQIDMLQQSGRTAQARQVAQRFLATYPNSPSAARLRSRFALPE